MSDPTCPSCGGPKVGLAAYMSCSSAFHTPPNELRDRPAEKDWVARRYHLHMIQALVAERKQVEAERDQLALAALGWAGRLATMRHPSEAKQIADEIRAALPSTTPEDT